MKIVSEAYKRFRRDAPYRSYERHLDRKLRRNPTNRDLAFVQAIGATNIELFTQQGDAQVAVLRHHKLVDGMALFDLGCGSGRTAQALQRSGWQGSYTGTDVVGRFAEHLEDKCPGYRAFRHRETNIPAPDATFDIVFHWSVFTHISPEECFLYMKDIFRTLKPGGKLIFSFLELADPAHQARFFARSAALERGDNLNMLDAFLHRDWICFWAQHIGFSEPRFTAGSDATDHPPFWQTLVAMEKS